jgi:hypothetical protein
MKTPWVRGTNTEKNYHPCGINTRVPCSVSQAGVRYARCQQISYLITKINGNSERSFKRISFFVKKSSKMQPNREVSRKRVRRKSNESSLLAMKKGILPRLWQSMCTHRSQRRKEETLSSPFFCFSTNYLRLFGSWQEMRHELAYGIGIT